MNISLTPEIQTIFDSLALEQGMESSDYAAHVLKKYTLSQVNNRTIERFKELPETEKLAIRESVTVAYEASKPKISGEILLEVPSKIG